MGGAAVLVGCTGGGILGTRYGTIIYLVFTRTWYSWYLYNRGFVVGGGYINIINQYTKTLEKNSFYAMISRLVSFPCSSCKYHSAALPKMIAALQKN